MKAPVPLVAAIIVVLTTAGCPSVKPPASAVPHDPDKVLYDRGMDAFAAQRYLEGVSLLETLVASYPQSPYAEQGEQALHDCGHLEACAQAMAGVGHGVR
jgi:outer membrane protein assembly factor BamD (BamD/ComL family)